MKLYPEFTTMVLLAYPQHATGEAVGVELVLALVVEDVVMNIVEELFVIRSEELDVERLDIEDADVNKVNVEELGAEEIEVVVITVLEVRELPIPVGELLELLLAVVDIGGLVEELLGIVIVPTDVKAVGENETEDLEFDDCEGEVLEGHEEVVGEDEVVIEADDMLEIVADELVEVVNEEDLVVLVEPELLVGPDTVLVFPCKLLDVGELLELREFKTVGLIVTFGELTLLGSELERVELEVEEVGLIMEELLEADNPEELGPVAVRLEALVPGEPPPVLEV
jgi:hypothetical protein